MSHHSCGCVHSPGLGRGDEALDAAVHGASARDGVGVGDDDEGRLLQEGDLDVELLRHPLGRHVAVVGPHDVLDVKTRLRAPGTNLASGERNEKKI